MYVSLYLSRVCVLILSSNETNDEVRAKHTIQQISAVTRYHQSAKLHAGQAVRVVFVLEIFGVGGVVVLSAAADAHTRSLTRTASSAWAAGGIARDSGRAVVAESGFWCGWRAGK